MITKTIGSEDFNFSDTLRVVYELRGPFNVKTFQEVLEKFKGMSFEEQLALLYTSYKCVNPSGLSQDDFTGKLFDNLGILAVADLASQIAEGLIYTGLTPEERGKYEKNLPQPTENAPQE